VFCRIFCGLVGIELAARVKGVVTSLVVGRSIWSDIFLSKGGGLIGEDWCFRGLVWVR